MSVALPPFKYQSRARSLLPNIQFRYVKAAFGFWECLVMAREPPPSTALPVLSPLSGCTGMTA